jgi:hypothetical protein
MSVHELAGQSPRLHANSTPQIVSGPSALRNEQTANKRIAAIHLQPQGRNPSRVPSSQEDVQVGRSHTCEQCRGMHCAETGPAEAAMRVHLAVPLSTGRIRVAPRQSAHLGTAYGIVRRMSGPSQTSGAAQRHARKKRCPMHRLRTEHSPPTSFSSYWSKNNRDRARPRFHSSQSFARQAVRQLAYAGLPLARMWSMCSGLPPPKHSSLIASRALRHSIQPRPLWLFPNSS